MAAAAVAARRKRAFLDDPFAALPQLGTKRGRCSPLADVSDLGVSMEFDPLDALQLIFPDAEPQHMEPATVAGTRKRGAGDDGDGDPFYLPQLQAKRGRCGEQSVLEELGVSLESDPVETLHLLFPDTDTELLRGYLESSGNVLDAAIRSFRDHLALGSETTSAGTSSSSAGTSDGPELNTPTSSAEWAELIVKEMSSSPDLIDAKNRAFRIIELLNKSTASCSTPDEEQKMREEHKILKQMLGGLLHQNGILKRAVLIQHNRLNEYHEMVEERAQFKEIVDKYQQQIKTLEMRLKQAWQSNSMPGRYNPDVF